MKIRNNIALFILLNCLSFAILAQNNKVDYLSTGHSQYDDGKYEDALKSYSKNLELVTQENPSDTLNQLVALNAVADANRKLRRLEDALKEYAKVIQLAHHKNNDQLKEAVHAEMMSAFIYSRKYYPYKALEAFQSLEPKIIALYGDTSSQHANLLMNMGIDYGQAGDYHQSEILYMKALHLFHLTSDKNDENFNRLYSNLGLTYKKIGDYKRAYKCAIEALRVKLIHYDKNHPSVAKYHLNIGLSQLELNHINEAINSLSNSVRIQEHNFPSNHPYVTGSYGELGHALLQNKEYDRAIDAFGRMANVDTQYIEYNHPYIVGMYVNIANTFNEQGQHRAALDNTLKALELLNSREDALPNKRAQIFLSLMDTYLMLDDTKEAINIGLKGLSNIFKEEGISTIQEIPNANLNINLRYYTSTVEQLSDAVLKRPINDNDSTENLKISISLLAKGIKAIGLIRSSIDSDESRRFLENESSDIFNKIVARSYKLYEQTQDGQLLIESFLYSELAKGNILKNIVNINNALKTADITDHILDSLQTLKSTINVTKVALSDEEDEELISQYNAELVKIRGMYTSLVKHIELNYPRFHQLKYSSQNMNIEDLINKCNKYETILKSYFIGSEHIYSFSVIEGELYGEKIEHKNKLPTYIRNLRNHLTSQSALNQNINSKDSLIEVCQQLRSLLNNPLSFGKDLRPKQIVIIPHQSLFHIPFELLDTNQTVSLSPNIYYSTSCSQWLSSSNENNIAPTKYKGFAPMYFGDTSRSRDHTFSSLHWNSVEIQNAHEILHGEIFLGKDATEANFKMNAGDASLLHLALHAHIDNEFPFRSGLAFTNSLDSAENNFLSLQEIYGLNMDANTLILNGCNSGFGQLSNGDGVMSLANAFHYAGCENIVMNLWAADDQSSSQILSLFYQYLKEGEALSIALSKAKTEYLKHADPLRSHPYFWAGLVLQGGAQKFTKKTFNPFYLLLLFPLIILLLKSLPNKRPETT